VVALDELLSVGSERGDRLSLVDTLEDTGAEDPVAVFESQEMKGILANSINRLGEREKIVITLYYYEDSPWPRSGRSWASPSRGSARCTPRPCSSSGRRCRTRADGPVPGGSERVVATVAASRAGPVVIATVAAGRAGPD
jgi:hypothetical protein